MASYQSRLDMLVGNLACVDFSMKAGGISGLNLMTQRDRQHSSSELNYSPPASREKID